MIHRSTLLLAFVVLCLSSVADSSASGTTDEPSSIATPSATPTDGNKGLFDELSKLVTCFSEMNCSSCHHVRGCIWCNHGHLVATTASSRYVLLEGHFCWPGSFMHAEDASFGIDLAGAEISIGGMCAATRVVHLNCRISDGAIMGLIIASVIVVCLGAIIWGICAQRKHYRYTRV